MWVSAIFTCPENTMMCDVMSIEKNWSILFAIVVVGQANKTLYLLAEGATPLPLRTSVQN
jgi:hypothetical protein